MNKLEFPINVAVFPCGSEVGLEAYRALRYSRHVKLFGFSSVEDHGKVVFEQYVGDLPMLSAPDFLEKMSELIREKEIQFLIPGMDEVGYYLKKYEHELGCEVVYADMDCAEIIRRKSSTYEALLSTVRVPDIYKLDELDAVTLPIFAKPDIGYGSREAEVINDVGRLEFYKKKNLENRLFSEYLPGEEYTVDCLSDTHGKLLFAGARKRNRIRMGISVSTEIVKQDIIEGIASRISRKLKMSGVWFFQVKRASDGEFALLEVASRISGSMALYRLCGINFVLLDLFQRCGYPVIIPKLSIEHAVLERSFDVNLLTELNYNNLYVDFDDCLIIGDKVNTDLVKLIFQCINKGGSVKLVTRHDGDIEKRLRSLRLNALFDEVIHLTDRDICKSNFIKETNAIFIDDSFVERNRVYQATGIPVFGPDAVEGLLRRSEL